MQLGAPGHADFQIVLGKAAVVCARIVDRRAQHAVVFEYFCNRSSHKALAAQFKKIFRGGIGEAHDEFAIDDDDRRRE